MRTFHYFSHLILESQTSLAIATIKRNKEKRDYCVYIYIYIYIYILYECSSIKCYFFLFQIVPQIHAAYNGKTMMRKSHLALIPPCVRANSLPVSIEGLIKALVKSSVYNIS